MKNLLFISLIFLFGCTDPNGARSTLERAGYTDVSTGGYDFFACSEDDFYATKFTAKAPNGAASSGTVCSGFFFKNSTIRY